jgi:hypothetical protein
MASARQRRAMGMDDLADEKALWASQFKLSEEADCIRCFREAGGFLKVRMFLCPKCGNKRCPKATDHSLKCTNSNEPGQKGSHYE